ncbi:MAG: DUF3108 domain-containing protein [Gammaproteobacteria bacterium]|nr:DUF3108 domain-containing protein [Gammaproteobacteria bacterium]
MYRYLAAFCLLLAACTPTPRTLQGPLAIEASYRLLFNDALVGQALFVLEIGRDGHYRLDAFTRPAGQMQNRADHEVLESSEGVLDAQGARPERFEHSVMQDGELELVGLKFDWAQQALWLEGPQPRRMALLPDTQDRLSYLLAAHDLAATGEGSRQLQVASADAAEETILEVTGQSVVEVPLGHYQATGIRRISPDPDEHRTLWFDTRLVPLPLRIVHQRDDNVVEMQLEEVNRRRSDPR